MFTGIIQGKGKVISLKKNTNLYTITIYFPKKLIINLKEGDSVSNDGCCLSVIYIKNQNVTFNIIQETLNLTNFKNIKINDEINLERAMKYNEEIGGHIMSGHIITTAKIKKINKSKNNLQLWFELNDIKLMKYILYKGFIGIDGISLTVGKIFNNQFSVNLIPETIKRTTIAKKYFNKTTLANIEIDFQTKTIVDTTEKIISNLNKYIINKK